MRTRAAILLHALVADTARLVPVLAAIVFACCSGESGGPQVTPAEPSSERWLLEEVRRPGVTKVDVLFVVDDSASMVEEQQNLSAQVEVMTRELIAPTVPYAPALEDVRIGVISSDLRSSGVLQETAGLAGCSDEEGERWLEHSCLHPDDGRDPGEAPLWEDAACRAALGTGGSSIEQPFEAALMALTDQAAPGMPNEGFLREGSVLAIVFVTDEDDCSVADPALLELVDDGAGDRHMLCVDHEDLLYPVSRYHDAFLELVGNDLNRIFVAAITGVPVDGSWNPGDPIEALREMQQVYPSNPNELMKSCDTTIGTAYPPVRIAELIYAFDTNGVLESICRQEWTAVLLVLPLGFYERHHCVSHDLDASDLARCRVIEVLSDDRACPHPAEPAGSGRDRRSGWHVDLGTIEMGNASGQMITRRRCEILTADDDLDGNPDGGEACPSWSPDEAVCSVPLVDPSCLQGWFFRRMTSDCDRGEVLFTNEEILEDRSVARLECRISICPAIRQCIEAARSEEPCGTESCDGEDICVRHLSGEICGWDSSDAQPQECHRCSPAVGSACPALRGTTPPEVTEAPLVGPGGCCAEGFHCDVDRCVPDRTTSCATSP